MTVLCRHCTWIKWHFVCVSSPSIFPHPTLPSSVIKNFAGRANSFLQLVLDIVFCKCQLRCLTLSSRHLYFGLPVLLITESDVVKYTAVTVICLVLPLVLSFVCLFFMTSIFFCYCWKPPYSFYFFLPVYPEMMITTEFSEHLPSDINIGFLLFFWKQHYCVIDMK